MLNRLFTYFCVAWVGVLVTAIVGCAGLHRGD
jgi:hypothetical protein